MEIIFTVPFVPPSANHYCKHTRNGGHYITPEARSFKQEVARFSRGQTMPDGCKYNIEIWLYLGKGTRLDLDNGLKVLL